MTIKILDLVYNKELKMKPVRWVSNSKKELLAFPKPVIREVGFAIWQAQIGERYKHTKLLKGFSGVYEIVIDHDKNAYKVVYMIQLKDAVYVLHAFQKKSKSGIKTPQEALNRVRQRLKVLIEKNTGNQK